MVDSWIALARRHALLILLVLLNLAAATFVSVDLARRLRSPVLPQGGGIVATLPVRVPSPTPFPTPVLLPTA
ncbi:MAG: hypothetical protein ACP5SI_12640, partial [Chloroflexia bacterium]